MSKYEIVVSCLHLDVEDLDLSERILDELGDEVHLTCVDGDSRVRAAVDAECATSAFEAVVQSLHDLDVTVVAPRPTLLSISDIAEMVSLRREAVRLWTIGKRGPGDFPEPVDIVGDRMKVWSAADVWEWLSDHHLPHPKARPLTLEEVTACKHALDRLRRRWSAVPLLTFAPEWRPVRGAAQADGATVPVQSSRGRGSARVA